MENETRRGYMLRGSIRLGVSLVFSLGLINRICVCVSVCRAGSLNHFSGEPDRGASNFSQSQRGISNPPPSSPPRGF